MGSGPRFCINKLRDYWSLGFTFVPGHPHEYSFYLDLIKIQIYVGIGKGYDE